MRRMSTDLLLFDIDGTLLLTDGAGKRAMQTAATRVFGEHFTFDGVSFGGRLDPAIFADAARNNGLEVNDGHHEQFRDAYLAELNAVLNNGQRPTYPLPGVLELLGELRRRVAVGDPVTLGLLSGNYRTAMPLKLRAADIDPDWFTLTALGDEADTRPGLVELALQRYEQAHAAPADPERVIVIGDTPHDIDCAKAHGCVAFAVATGACTRDELERAGADVVVDDLSDPSPLLERLG